MEGLGMKMGMMQRGGRDVGARGGLTGAREAEHLTLGLYPFTLMLAEERNSCPRAGIAFK